MIDYCCSTVEGRRRLLDSHPGVGEIFWRGCAGGWLSRPILALKGRWQCGQGMVAADGGLLTLVFLACLRSSAAVVLLASFRNHLEIKNSPKYTKTANKRPIDSISVKLYVDLNDIKRRRSSSLDEIYFNFLLDYEPVSLHTLQGKWSGKITRACAKVGNEVTQMFCSLLVTDKWKN